MAKKSNRRSRTKYPGLDKTVNLLIRHELLDQDYVHKLTDKEKQWLSNFNEEYVSANFNHPGPTLHKSKKMKRDCYNRNNARNRDSYSITKSAYILEGENKLPAGVEKNRSTNERETEEVWVAKIDVQEGFKDGE